jgi:hypothetical protein
MFGPHSAEVTKPFVHRILHLIESEGLIRKQSYKKFGCLTDSIEIGHAEQQPIVSGYMGGGFRQKSLK